MFSMFPNFWSLRQRSGSVPIAFLTRAHRRVWHTKVERLWASESSSTNGRDRCGVRNERRLPVREYWANARDAAMFKRGMFSKEGLGVLASEAKGTSEHKRACARFTVHTKEAFNYKTRMHTIYTCSHNQFKCQLMFI